jgi:hypothetical protein
MEDAYVIVALEYLGRDKKPFGSPGNRWECNTEFGLRGAGYISLAQEGI